MEVKAFIWPLFIILYFIFIRIDVLLQTVSPLPIKLPSDTGCGAITKSLYLVKVFIAAARLCFNYR